MNVHGEETGLYMHPCIASCFMNLGVQFHHLSLASECRAGNAENRIMYFMYQRVRLRPSSSLREAGMTNKTDSKIQYASNKPVCKKYCSNTKGKGTLNCSTWPQQSLHKGILSVALSTSAVYCTKWPIKQLVDYFISWLTILRFLRKKIVGSNLSNVRIWYIFVIYYSKLNIFGFWWSDNTDNENNC